MAADTILKNKKMLHLLILNQTQLTNEVLFSYSSGITELMSLINFKTFVPEMLHLVFMNENHDSRYMLCHFGLYWRDITCSYYIIVSAAILDTILKKLRLFQNILNIIFFKITMSRWVRNATYLPFWLTSNENVSLLNFRLKCKHCPKVQISKF